MWTVRRGWIGSYGDCTTGWIGSYGDCMTGLDRELWGLYDGVDRELCVPYSTGSRVEPFARLAPSYY